VKHSDLERQLEVMGRELMQKLLQAHLDLRQPGEAKEPVQDAHSTPLEPTAPPSGITHDGRCGKLILPPASPEFAAACREHVLHPLGLTAVSERDDESIGRSKDVHGGAVDLSRLAPHVRENTETRKPGCEQPGDSVRDSQVEGCYPSFPESNQEDGHQQGNQ
jgi:hypothetical protein